ncbi:MAG: DUF3570 domain-containing protein [Campylobacterota bacterium]|nr:DUF3570 domain-containing protein [Campylobacterota bacterium]
MQLRLSLIASTLLVGLALEADDYVSIEYLQYNENENRTSVSAPSIILNKDFGTDYTLNASLVVDVVSGAHHKLTITKHMIAQVELQVIVLVELPLMLEV